MDDVLLSPAPSSNQRTVTISPTLQNSGANIDSVPVSPSEVLNPTLESVVNSLVPTIVNSAEGVYLTDAPTTLYDPNTGLVRPPFSQTGDFVPEPTSNTTTSGPTETPANDDALLDEVTESPSEPESGESISSLRPTLSPTVVNITNATDTGTNSTVMDDSANDDGTGIRLAVLIPILAGIELMIVVGLFAFYRHWKKKRHKLLSNSDDDHHVPSSPATSVSTSTEETEPPPPELPPINRNSSSHPGIDNNRGRLGSSTPLSTIVESSLYEV